MSFICHTPDMPAGLTAAHCPRDGTRSEITALTWCCPVCRGPWDLDFTPARGVAPNALSGRADSLWRYEEFLPLAAPPISLGEGRTPLVPLTPSPARRAPGGSGWEDHPDRGGKTTPLRRPENGHGGVRARAGSAPSGGRTDARCGGRACRDGRPHPCVPTFVL